MLEIIDIESFKVWLANEQRQPAAIQDLQLEGYTQALSKGGFDDSLFLGCELDSIAAGNIVKTGGIVIPDLDGLEFQTHRSTLYSVDDLFEGFDFNDPDGYQKTRDNRIYQQYLQHGKEAKSIRVSFARRLHDHSITNALNDVIEDRRVVAIMGGHGMERSHPNFAKVARIARALTREKFLMVSGGGPGAMEATHVGAYFATRPDHEMDEAISILKVRPAGAKPGKEYADQDWLHRAWKVMEKFPILSGTELDCESVGIPTWLYGHEPPSPFATKIAKYFANSVREDGLLAIARHGVIFAPGSAGTTQEIFQDAAQNHYANQDYYSPMILMDEEFWTCEKPVWPLLRHVAKNQTYGELLAISDSEVDIVERIKSYDPTKYKKKI